MVTWMAQRSSRSGSSSLSSGLPGTRRRRLWKEQRSSPWRAYARHRQPLGMMCRQSEAMTFSFAPDHFPLLCFSVFLLFFSAPPAPRYGLPPYLIAKDLREGLIPFPYLAHTVCIPSIPCRAEMAGLAELKTR